ncbi:MAG: UDP-N-acetylglucosamine 2-epimerase (non-hydrolyzing) [Candidatus Nealsonbacteria bacterium]|nr:UDP-N-acetylglucosamine 2-epimerase (non-hydrolyzing) [Candidatus Nealsonbacteria bacterium]
MTDLHLACVVGARPNFMKMAPLLRALEAYSHVHPILIHTGQHYDENLSDIFFDELGMKRPDVSLDVGSGKHGVQTAKVLKRFEALLEQGTPGEGNRYDRVVVVGDVNSTMAATLAAVKLGVPVAHVEAGLRSFDRSMPEEINRMVTDSICDMLLVSEPAGLENLRREGHPDDRLHLVGNVMIDTLRRLLPKAKARDTLNDYDLNPGRYGVITLHRPANVDAPETLARLLDVLVEVSRELRLVFPLHPRTKQRIERFGLAERLDAAKGILQLGPLGYLDFLALTSQAKVIITDSGGLQEESTALGIPCLTARPNTERPITVTEGTSTLVDGDPTKLRHNLRAVLDGTYKQGRCPALWDGRAAERIAPLLAGVAGQEQITTG